MKKWRLARAGGTQREGRKPDQEIAVKRKEARGMRDAWRRNPVEKRSQEGLRALRFGELRGPDPEAQSPMWEHARSGKRGRECRIRRCAGG